MKDAEIFEVEDVNLGTSETKHNVDGDTDS